MKNLLLSTAIFTLFFALAGCSSEDGKDGTNGTANVIYSDWAPVAFTGPTSPYVGNISAPTLTQEIIDRGTILVYYKTTLNNNVYSIPASYNSFAIYQSYTVGQIRLTSTDNLSTNVLFRYVIIPGGTPAVAARAASNLQKMSYQEVCDNLAINP